MVASQALDVKRTRDCSIFKDEVVVEIADDSMDSGHIRTIKWRHTCNNSSFFVGQDCALDHDGVSFLITMAQVIVFLLAKLILFEIN